MNMKNYAPTTPGRRQMTKEDFSVLTKKKAEKKLLVYLPKRAGRARSGRITMRHRGGGARRMYRIIDFGQAKLNIPAKVVALEYDPYRTAFIMLLEYQGGDKRYRIAPNGIRAGDEIICAEKTEVKTGNRMFLGSVPVGTAVYEVELQPGRGGQLARSAGNGATVLAHEGKYTNLGMPSGEVRKILSACFASVGTVSRPEHIYIQLGKAGKSRYKGRRPHVRGTAMNPVDHPHGGGEGRAPIGLKHPKTPWGKPALGVKTRRRKWTNKYILQRRRKK
ncbi:MAG: 50S ribosomal protein L2 [Candidatus Wildermuthbacteria bacterium RIFCSPHIGHO2_01_FULL_47_27]|uniref:Large ribosomal subunit protein uL2 n=1 Tax=Candidatus Wildermuthbacteria bacterium RIFCSPHIGHO2_02_FULL_47_17 TaxID=1802452 RepID=A0A1G2R6C9_9BACT|nr:MAG: 50S ribosomal protein L2 [Candidatus Wildermuthbacteria bacterium RIFCSPHIGHO2_01_FULL_47_27]OHA67802.1 MAG: 50S ribosomal protein L2 [Candidatus Wildermuthbacteria bacterium RIFCSPHIGHO2_02_FULL_47_17]OHA74787.1 MAG: 50S ribosomal protein L2 [Candidatus Wildermuthbacteria bacterium RIFCSPLOWO2_02_FULL_47_10]